MFKNYFKTALRSLSRNRNYTIINIAGLAAGIAVCLVIFIIIQFHSGYDNFHAKKDRIYRVLTEYHHADVPDIFYGKGVPFPMPQGLKTEFPQLEKVAPFYSSNDDQFLVLNSRGETAQKFKEKDGIFFTEPAFFKIFDFPLLAGSYESLGSPNNALLTKETAEKYFGDWKNAMGKSIKFNNTDVLKVSGILATIPANTDFQLKIVISLGSGFTKDFSTYTSWDGTAGGFGCYVLLPKDISASGFNTQLRAYAKKVKSADNKDSHIIQPLSAVHFDTKTGNYGNKSISHELINALWLIAAFILLIACVNFINLSTAQAVNRAKEVGVRKVLGSNKRQLKMQFLTETFLIVFISCFIICFDDIDCITFCKQNFGTVVVFQSSCKLPVILFILSAIVVVTLLAGFYPSIVLSAFNPINALKSKISSNNARGISLRKALVVFQFVIAQALIIGTLIIVKQMNYFNNQPLGFDKDAVVNVPFPADSAGISKLDYLRQQLSAVDGINTVSFSSNTPIEDDNDNWTNIKYNHALKETDFYAIIKFADNEYVPAYKLPFIAGRNLNHRIPQKNF